MNSITCTDFVVNYKRNAAYNHHLEYPSHLCLNHLQISYRCHRCYYWYCRCGSNFLLEFAGRLEDGHLHFLDCRSVVRCLYPSVVSYYLNYQPYPQFQIGVPDNMMNQFHHVYQFDGREPCCLQSDRKQNKIKAF